MANYTRDHRYLSCDTEMSDASPEALQNVC
jgi:hypothetical protein